MVRISRATCSCSKLVVQSGVRGGRLAEAYLEPFRIFAIEPFCEDSERHIPNLLSGFVLLVANWTCTKTLLSSKML